MGMGTCRKEGCTVIETGTCLQSHADLSACPHYEFEHHQDSTHPAEASSQQVAAPMASNQGRQFPGGYELGTEQCAAIMRARYSYIIGILGSWNAGKTCFLLSLYLMASRGALPKGYLFAGSQTLPGFEARANRLRRWRDGPLPEQLTDHTNLSDPRCPAFLHLTLRPSGAPRIPIDVLLTDLPGEWSKNLVDRADTAQRFDFLKRADGIVLVVDGPLIESPKRHSELQRSKHLLERLVDAVEVDTTMPFVLLVSKCDELQMKRPGAIDELEAHAKSLGFDPEVVLSAAFSRTPEIVENGRGVFEVLEKIVDHSPQPVKISEEVSASYGRPFLDFRVR